MAVTARRTRRERELAGRVGARWRRGPRRYSTYRRSGNPAAQPLRRPPMPVTEAQVIDALRPVQDPELHRSHRRPRHGAAGRIDGGRVEVLIALDRRRAARCAPRSRSGVTDAVGALDGVDRGRRRLHRDDRRRARRPLREQAATATRARRPASRPGPRPRGGPAQPLHRRRRRRPACSASPRARAASASPRSP